MGHMGSMPLASSQQVLHHQTRAPRQPALHHRIHQRPATTSSSTLEVPVTTQIARTTNQIQFGRAATCTHLPTCPLPSNSPLSKIGWTNTGWLVEPQFVSSYVMVHQK